MINIISGISVAGMAIGTAALVIILSVFNGFNKLVSDSLGDAQPDLVVKPAAGKAFVPDSTAFAWLYDQELVYNMSSVIEEQAFIAFDGKQSLARVKGVDSVFEEESPIQNHITDGIFSLHRGDLPRAVVGSSLAWSMDINPRFIAPLEIYYPDREGSISLSNPAASLRSTKVTVAGLFAINAELDAELVIVPIETMRELMDYDDEVSAVEIRVQKGTSDKALDGLAAELSERLGPDYEVLDRYRQNEALYKMMRYEKLAIYMILIFIVIIIAFNIYSSLTMLIIEKKDDIVPDDAHHREEGRHRHAPQPRRPGADDPADLPPGRLADLPAGPRDRPRPRHRLRPPAAEVRAHPDARQLHHQRLSRHPEGVGHRLDGRRRRPGGLPDRPPPLFDQNN